MFELHKKYECKSNPYLSGVWIVTNINNIITLLCIEQPNQFGVRIGYKWNEDSDNTNEWKLIKRPDKDHYPSWF